MPIQCIISFLYAQAALEHSSATASTLGKESSFFFEPISGRKYQSNSKCTKKKCTHHSLSIIMLSTRNVRFFAWNLRWGSELKNDMVLQVASTHCCHNYVTTSLQLQLNKKNEWRLKTRSFQGLIFEGWSEMLSLRKAWSSKPLYGKSTMLGAHL